MVRYENVTKKFGKITALEGVSFRIEPGEFVFLIGPSGAGKTTIINLLLRDYHPTSGTISFGGVDLRQIPKKKLSEYRRRLGVVFQDLKILSDQTVFENVALPLKILDKKEDIIKEEVTDTLRQLDLEDKTDLFPAQLAGGEVQRVCLARAMVGKPEIVIADEPTGNLDLGNARKIVKLLQGINKTGKTVIMATHNFEIVNSAKERVIELCKGKVVSDQKKGKYHLT